MTTSEPPTTPELDENEEQIISPTPITSRRANPVAPSPSPSASVSVSAVASAAESLENGSDEESGVDGGLGSSPSSAPIGASRLSLVTPKSIGEQHALSEQLDRLSLEQALLDVEVANARVLDLTARLVEANQRIATLNLDVDAATSQSAKIKVEAEVEVIAVRNEMIEKQAYLDAQRSSSAFKWASKVWNIRNALRGS